MKGSGRGCPTPGTHCASRGLCTASGWEQLRAVGSEGHLGMSQGGAQTAALHGAVPGELALGPRVTSAGMGSSGHCEHKARAAHLNPSHGPGEVPAASLSLSLAQPPAEAVISRRLSQLGLMGGVGPPWCPGLTEGKGRLSSSRPVSLPRPRDPVTVLKDCPCRMLPPPRELVAGAASTVGGE